MHSILWEVKFLSPPEALRHCKKCGAKTAHVPSGSFRVNAQQKLLDIWLIYHCAHCKTTWNLTIYSRVSPKSIRRDLLDQFTVNDATLALRYAMDTDLINKNGAETKAPPYEVQGEGIDLAGTTCIKITSEFPLNIRLSKILQKKLSLSQKTFDELALKGMIRLHNGADIRKCKLQHEAVILIGCPPNGED